MKPAIAGVLTAEAYRNAELAAAPAAKETKPEEKISIFWRVFGGTLLSIAALVVMTVYQQFSNSLNELRNNMNRLHETHVDMVKKEDYNARSTSIWNAINQVKDEVPTQKTRVTQLEVLVQGLQQERKELSQQVQMLREKLVAIEARQGFSPRSDKKNGSVEPAAGHSID
jgi:septal ring factor EnvC (AmiA/AmiB activator)